MFRHTINEDTDLRLLEPRHAPELYALIDRNREHLGRWLSLVERRLSVEDTHEYIRQCMARCAEDGSPYCGIWHQGRLAGTIDVMGCGGRSRCAEIGYWLGKEYQGHGLITSACQVIVDHSFAHLGVNRIEIRAEPANPRSRAVAERLGFTEEGTLRQVINMGDRFADRTVYALLREEWQDTGERLAFSHPLTEDAELRLLLPHYAEEIYSLVDNNREHLRWMTFTDGTRSVEDIRNFIRHSLQEMAEGKGQSVAIAQQGRLVGIFGAGGINRNSQKVEIGYWLAEEFQGKGLMTLAGRTMLSHLFTTVGLNRIEVRCDVRNTRSRALAERMGFVYEGTKRQADKIGGEFVDMHYLGLLREEWEAQQV